MVGLINGRFTISELLPALPLFDHHSFSESVDSLVTSWKHGEAAIASFTDQWEDWAKTLMGLSNGWKRL